MSTIDRTATSPVAAPPSTPAVETPLEHRLRLYTVRPSIVLTCLGLIASILSDYQLVAQPVDHYIHSQGIHFAPRMNALAWAAQLLWVAGAAGLLIGPVICNRALLTSLEINLTGRSLLPFLLIAGWQEIAISIFLTYGAILMLIAVKEVPGSVLWKVLFPNYWADTFTGKNGAGQASVLGMECLGFAKALLWFGPVPAAAVGLLGSAYLWRFCWMDWKAGKPFMGDWNFLNGFYTTGFAIKFAGVVWLSMS
jgi:hypothetical protein